MPHAPDLFVRELQTEESGHLYARECTANTWYAIGATRWHQSDADGARCGFHECFGAIRPSPRPSDPLAEVAVRDCDAEAMKIEC